VHCGLLYYEKCGLQNTHKLGGDSCETFVTTYPTTRRKIPKTTIFKIHKRFLDYILFSFTADGATHELATNQELKKEELHKLTKTINSRYFHVSARINVLTFGSCCKAAYYKAITVITSSTH
jgi:hypothetical protein